MLLATLACAPADVTALLAERDPQVGIVIKENTIVRTDPVKLAPELDILPKGIRVRILKKGATLTNIANQGDFWYFIRTQEGLEGWVFGSSLNLRVSTESETAVADDPEVLTKLLIGKWWQVSDTGRTGYLKIYFWPDGKYRDGYGNNLTGKGEYEILPAEKAVKLTPRSRMGTLLHFQQIGNDFRLTATGRKGRTYTLRRGSTNPDAPEVGLQVPEDDE